MSTAARSGQPVRATVCANGIETEYLRAGIGAVVLLLVPTDALHEQDVLLQSLASEMLVIAPRVTVNVPFAIWLSDFLDGVGVTRFDIVAVGALGRAAFAYAASDTARVGRVTWYPASHQQPCAADRALRRDQTTNNSSL